MNLDWALFQALNGLAGRWPAFDGTVQFLMNDYALPTALSALLVALWFHGRTPEERQADQAVVLYTVVAVFLSAIVIKLLNLAFFRPRPFSTHDDVILLFYHPSDSSLPSNAATVAFVFAFGVAQRSRGLGAVGIALGSILGLSRVIGGVHYPLDIVAGALVGGGTVLFVSRCSRFLAPLARMVQSLGRRVLLA